MARARYAIIGYGGQFDHLYRGARMARETTDLLHLHLSATILLPLGNE